MTYNPEERLTDLILECIDNEELSSKEIHEKLIESIAYATEYHQNCFKKSQELFNLLRG